MIRNETGRDWTKQDGRDWTKGNVMIQKRDDGLDETVMRWDETRQNETEAYTMMTAAAGAITVQYY